MPDKEQLIEYYRDLCDNLNKNGFRQKDGSEYFVDEITNPDLNAMMITQDLSAYQFLEKNNLIRKDMCHFCGNSPVDGSCTFTEPENHITLNICRDCHPQGHAANKDGNGCMVSLSLILFAPFLLFILL